MAKTYGAFEAFRVYRLSEAIADEIWEMVGAWPSLARDTVGKQLVRAADSIGANIAEGCGRWNYQDNRRFVRIARGSLNETRHWLRRAYRRKLLTEAQVGILKRLLEDLPPSLNAYLNSIGRSAGQNPRGDRPSPQEVQSSDRADDGSTPTPDTNDQ
jgi:four helix bundle protein